MFGRLITLTSLAAMLLLGMAPAQAGTVRVAAQREDLADNIPGADRWMAHYVVTLESRLTEFYTVSLLFTPQTYSNLQLLPQPRTDLSSLVVQPDLMLMADGLVQFTALEALLTGDTFSFDVEYVRTGLTTGVQGFEVLGSEYEFIGSGNVAEPGIDLPEPDALMLASAAMAALAWQRRRPYRADASLLA